VSAVRVINQPSSPREGAGFRVTAELSSLLPGGCLRPGTTVSAGGDLPLLLALAAEAATQAGAWGVVGLPQLGVLAAESMGLDVGLGLFVDDPGQRWPEVVATLAEVVPVLLLGGCGPATGRTAQRLGAVLRRTGAVLLTAGVWEGADVRLSVTRARWEGVGIGHGLLRAREVEVTASGRGAAVGSPHPARLWLPGQDGHAAPLVDDDSAVPLDDDAATAAQHRLLHVVR
jgi:hypothetical protein